MTYLISILSQFETRYKMVLILTLGLILFVLATAGKLHAEDHSKAQMQYMTGLKLMKDQSQNGITDHAKDNIWFTMAAHGEHKGALFHLGVSYEKGQGVEKDLEAGSAFLSSGRHTASCRRAI